MSREYPCVYYDNEKCRKDPPEEGYVDWCVMGPCSYQTPSNGDRIRAMSDEELADWLTCFDRCEHCAYEGHCTSKCIGGIKKKLKQPAEEVDG